jgi:hypothetical protein
MTENENGSADTGENTRTRWVDEVQEALDRTGDAIRTAWDATRDSRASALESAKQAVTELSEVIDKGIAAAKERWAAADQEVDNASEPDATETPSVEIPADTSEAGSENEATEGNSPV